MIANAFNFLFQKASIQLQDEVLREAIPQKATIIEVPNDPSRKKQAYTLLRSIVELESEAPIIIFSDPNNQFIQDLDDDPSLNLNLTDQTRQQIQELLARNPEDTPQKAALHWIDLFTNPFEENSQFWEDIQKGILSQSIESSPAKTGCLLQTLKFCNETLQEASTDYEEAKVSVMAIISQKICQIEQTLEKAPTHPGFHQKVNTTEKNRWLAKAKIMEIIQNPLPGQCIIMVEPPLDLAADLVQTQKSTQLTVVIVTSQNTEQTGVLEYSDSKLTPRENQPSQWQQTKTWGNGIIPFNLSDG